MPPYVLQLCPSQVTGDLEHSTLFPEKGATQNQAQFPP